MHAIEVNNIFISFKEVKAVNGLSFTVKKGSLFALLGPNGAGKSTTIDAICTLRKLDSGSIKVLGFDTEKEVEEIRKRIGVVYQHSVLDDILTVKENLLIRGAIYYKDKDELNKIVDDVIKKTEIEAYSNRRYGRLSGGQKRRADIARALLNSPEVLFLDEPSTGLDPQTRTMIWDLIYKLKEENNMTILLTTHYMQEAENSDYIVIVDEGDVVVSGSPSELKMAYAKDRVNLDVLNVEEVTKVLDKNGYSYKVNKKRVTVEIKEALDFLEILNEIKSNLNTFELIHGTIDDVFINITGKEIRE